MPSATAHSPSARTSAAEVADVLSAVRPALVAVILLAAVALTGVLLALFWPVGVALGLAIGTAAVLVIGARMQMTERVQPADEELAARLGIESTGSESPVVESPALATATAQGQQEAGPAVAAQPAAPAAEDAPALPTQPDVLYFTSDDDPDRAEARVLADDPVRTDLDSLKAQLGDDYRDFARAARLVVSTQYASAARLQRDLDLPYARARRLLADLEEQHFVGPATGSLPRQVLMPKERLPEVERLLTEA
jgi:hypothetical protein